MNQVQAEFSTAPESRLDLRQLRVPILFFAACVAAQLYLVFFKSFNWDEFLHYTVVYRLKAGQWHHPFQALHLRWLGWTTDVAPNLLDQMLAARILAWIAHLLTLFMIYGIARRFFNPKDSFFAAFAYMTAGFVFTQSFSIRSDPFVTATLMSALFLFSRRRFELWQAISIGALVGLAGMMTVKAVFYAPCFAGLAWLKLCENSDRRRLVARLVVMATATLAFFAILYAYHTWDFPKASSSSRQPSIISFFLRWLTTDRPYSNFVVGELILGVVFFASAAIAPWAWEKAGLQKDERIALIGFIAPLAVLPFYRNTFPYFYTFLLAPVAVTIAPSLGRMRARYSDAFVSFILASVPIALAVLEPRDVIRSQRALVDYIHKEYPKNTGYLDYSGMIADYPRILEYLTTGNGARLYNELGEPIVSREIDRGNVPFIIGNQETILAALQDRPIPGTFLSDDMEAMRGNYVQQWGVLWREGKLIPTGPQEFVFNLRRGGQFVLDGAPVTIDGQRLGYGEAITLKEGNHLVGGARKVQTTLWRGNRLPGPHPDLPMDIVFTAF